MSDTTCNCKSCGSKAELNENSEGTLWYKCTECSWFGLKYSEVVEELKEKCEYCEVDKLNLLIESDKIWNMIYFFAGKDKPLQEDDIDTVDNSVVLEIRNGQGYLRLGDRCDMNCIDHSDVLKINYCPMCGRKL